MRTLRGLRIDVLIPTQTMRPLIENLHFLLYDGQQLNEMMIGKDDRTVLQVGMGCPTTTYSSMANVRSKKTVVKHSFVIWNVSVLTLVVSVLLYPYIIL